MEINKEIGELLYKVKEKNPLVHHITNYVTVNDCANIVLAIGGSPVMADAIEEVEDMVSISSSLVINIGTLNKRVVEAMIAAGKKANKLNIPVILDPVGAGATPYRKETALRLINEVKFSVIKGNFSEIKILSGMSALCKGVDSEEASLDSAEAISKELSKKLKAVIAVTGKTDFISNGTRVIKIENGHETLKKVTGTGCMTASLIGTYLGVTKDYEMAAAAGVMTMGLAGEIAAEQMINEKFGSGTLRAKILDSVFNLNYEDIVKRGRAYEG